MATWLSTGNKSHDVAFLKGPDGKFHHMSFALKDWAKVTDQALLKKVSFPLVKESQLEDSLNNLAAASNS